MNAGHSLCSKMYLSLRLSNATSYSISAFRSRRWFGKNNLRASSFVLRCYSNFGRSAFRGANVASKRSIKERLMSPEKGSAISIGQVVLAGASVLGLGQLCYYGLGLGSQPGAIDKSLIWPEYVRGRIKNTYKYFGGSIAITAISACLAIRSPILFSLLMKNSWTSIGVSFAAIFGSGMLVHSIPYSEGFSVKNIAWIGHCGIIGTVLAPLCLLGGPLLLKAAWCTAAVVGSLSMVAICAPSEKYLSMSGPLACGLSLVLASSLGSMFLPPTTVLGAGLHSMVLYGGLVLFSAFLLYETQRIIAIAEGHPLDSVAPFDPINASLSVYMDTLNIFIRIAMLLAGGGSRKK